MTQSLNLSFDDNHALPILFGEQNNNLTYLEQKLAISVASRGNAVSITGDKENVKIAESILNSLYKLATKNKQVTTTEIDDELRFHMNEDAGQSDHKTVIKTKKKTILARSPAQQKYLDILADKHLTFATGPAGTGKTFLAVAAAVNMFLSKEVERIILSRPAVEAGEKLGFLPGDLNAKLDPYLRPLYDALFEMLPQEEINKLMENGQIEIAPLAFMRGRTLSNSFIILDEAQNTTPSQMKMFLTRLGMGSRMAITGDMSQIDLPKNQSSGLVDAIKKLEKIEDIDIIHFSHKDVVRHPIAAKIVDAYDKYGEPDLLDKESWV